MARSQFAFGKVFGAVGAAANTLTTTFETLDSSLEMVASSVHQARYKQSVRHAAERLDYVQEVAFESLQAAAERSSAIDKLVADGKISEEQVEETTEALKAALVAKGLIPA